MQTKLLKTFVTLATLACSLAVSAHDFEHRGIFYNITDAKQQFTFVKSPTQVTITSIA